MPERIGIFGGSFDPPHIGHMILAGEAFHDLKLDRLLWLLTPHPPHKTDQPITPWQHRLAMLKLCLGDDSDFEINSVDIDRLPPHYAVDTMRLLTGQFPSSQLIYIMGGDSLRDLPSWHQPALFIQSCHLIGIMHRPGELIDLDRLEKQFPGIREKLQFMDAPLLGISSHEIRERIKQGDAFRYYLRDSVYHYILENHLYK